MKKLIPFLLMFLVILTVCGKKEQKAEFAEDSKVYQLMQAISDTFQIAVMSPAQTSDLILTKNFNVTNLDIMPGLYRMLSPYAKQLNIIPKNEVTDIIKKIANQEAERRLLLAEAMKKGISVPKDSVDAKLQEIYDSNGGKEQFLKGIATEAFSLNMVEEDVRTSLIIQKYVNDYVYSTIQVDEKDIEAEYEKNYKGDKTATVRHILMLTQGKTDEQKKEIKAKMESVLVQARAGKDFAELAKQYSEDPGSKDKGGLYEKFPRGQMVKPFEDASFNLPIGSISDLVETRYGYHIIKVVDREHETRTLDQLHDEIKNKLASSKKSAAIVEHVTKLKEENQFKEVFSDL